MMPNLFDFKNVRKEQFMSWLAVDSNENEYIFKHKQVPMWLEIEKGVPLPKGTIKKLIGRDLTWRDEPVELK